ncbi:MULTISPECIES: hypothetical protein [Methylomicrobium]|uniref:Transposase family protein n=1 Tax=Methylomicrobium album BG8 TaxID=686340 RepID=H8GLI0_METAL|nr:MULTISPECIES: hypothetical protein [Methylomicrobium]EIC29345.1 hypothetical protein Metal_1563 [Methylomicrobium album BG8]
MFDHNQASLWPSELVTIGLLFALKGVGSRAFYRWLTRNCTACFPTLPERTRLFRRLKTHWQWAQLFLAQPRLLGVIDSYGIELIHPIRRGRNPKGWGEPGIFNHRWIVGGKLCLALNHLGQIIGWAWAIANAHDTWFHPIVEVFKDRCVMLADTSFHAAKGDPPNLKICPRVQWNGRMLVETVYSMLTVVSHTKKMRHQTADYFQAHLAMAVAAFNLLIAWDGLPALNDGFVPLSIAGFNL